MRPQHSTVRARLQVSHTLVQPPTADRIGVLMPRDFSKSNGPTAPSTTEPTEKDTADAASLFTCIPGSKEFKRMFPDLSNGAPSKIHNDKTFMNSIDTIDFEDIAEDIAEELLAAAAIEETRKVKVAIDSGAVANVIRKGELPENIQIEPNHDDHHFVGAGGDRIRRHGTCKTIAVDSKGKKIVVPWHVADVGRSLHSVSEVTGPEEGDGLQDVLFNNKLCAVVPPGIVAKILERVKAITEYKRDGKLYTAEMTLSDFTRQGQGR